jgi:hypothetical protein
LEIVNVTWISLDALPEALTKRIRFLVLFQGGINQGQRLH